MTKKQRIIGLILTNSLIVVLGTIAIALQIFSSNGQGGVDFNGVRAFNYFTNDGNIFCIIVSLITMITGFMMIKNEDKKPSRLLYLASLASSVNGIIIFMVVILLLMPAMGMLLFNGYTMLILHAVNPILIVLQFILFYPREHVSFKLCIFGALPVLLYGAVSITLCVTKVWTGSTIPYPFLNVYANPLWQTLLYVVGILGGAYLISFLINKIPSMEK